MKLTTALLTLLTLTGCGFHLRAMHPLPEKLAVLHVKTPSQYSYFSKQLKRSLRSVNTQLVNTKQSSPYTLDIQRLKFTHSTPTLGTSTQARVYRLHYSVSYQLVSKHNKVILKPKTISTYSMLTLNRNQLLNTNDELELIKREMEKHLIDRLFYQLASPQVQHALR